MSKTVQIASLAQMSDLLKSSTYVVADFYADWCGPCKQTAPIYEQLSQSLSRPNQLTFVKVNTDTQKEIAAKYNVTAMPTFMVFKEGKQTDKVVGADVKKLQQIVKSLAAVASGSGSSSASSSGSSAWRTGDLPKGYSDVSDQVELKGLELLNADGEFGSVRVLLDGGKPSALDTKQKSVASTKDWVESDTDEQLMMFMPFQATLKIHTIQITSLPPSSSEDEDAELPMRPKTIQLYTNRPHILGFEEADDIPPTQTLTLTKKDWDAMGTASIALRYVKFQNVTSLVIFIVDGDGSSERVRVDRIRIIGETGEKRDGKIEKISDEH